MSEADGSTEERRQTRRRMKRAVTAVRREWQKVGVVYAVIDATLALVVVNLALRVLPVAAALEALSGVAVEIPESVAAPAALGRPGLQVATAAVVAAGVAVAVFVGELGYRLHYRPVERFEAANPEIREALRTARDLVEEDVDTRMSAALYDDVLERLHGTSSAGLLSAGRVTVTVLLVVAVSLVSIQASAVGFQVTLDGGAETGGGPGRTSEYAGLQDPDQILGEPEDVEPGAENIDTTVPTRGGGEGPSAPDAYDVVEPGADAATVESQQAGYAEAERLEDAELIREYNLRIRDAEDDD